MCKRAQSCKEPNYGVVIGVIIEYPINFASEINKLLDNFVILNPFRAIFTDYIPIAIFYKGVSNMFISQTRV